jgi:hypothetical protein
MFDLTGQLRLRRGRLVLAIDKRTAAVDELRIGWRDVGSATLTAEAEYGRLRADDRLVLLRETRSGRYSSLTFGATFRQLTVGGFAPVTRVVIERNRSSVEFYDYKRKRTEIGIICAF